MAAFLGDIAFLLGVVVAAGGLLTLHRAAADPKPGYLKTAGVLLLVAGIGTALCTGYFWLKYHFAGDLEHPYPAAMTGESPGMGNMGGMQMRRMMKRGSGGMAEGGMSGDRRDPSAAEGETRREPAGAPGDGHEAHHPPESGGDPQ